MISYSPRQLGDSVAHASRIESSNRYTPTSATSLMNSLRLLHEPHDALPLEHGHAEVLRLGHAGQEDLRVGPGPLELRDEPRHTLQQHVVAEVHEERLAAHEVGGGHHGVRQPERRLLLE